MLETTKTAYSVYLSRAASFEKSHPVLHLNSICVVSGLRESGGVLSASSCPAGGGGVTEDRRFLCSYSAVCPQAHIVKGVGTQSDAEPPEVARSILDQASFL